MHHLTLKQLVSYGESRPGSPNLLLGPGSLGLSVTKKDTLTGFKEIEKFNDSLSAK